MCLGKYSHEMKWHTHGWESHNLIRFGGMKEEEDPYELAKDTYEWV